MDDEIQLSQTGYKYAPLHGLHSTRLLTLHPAASYETPVRISLREVSLDASVNFAALFYTWATENGDCSFTKSVECDGAIIKTTANCDAALRRLRQVEMGFEVWIDAICINQSNDSEKSRQIPLMRQIYRNALWVRLPKSTRWDTLPASGKGTKSILESRRWCVPPSVQGLWEIFHRPWWERLWVAQEVSLARSAVLLCGSRSVTFDKVEIVIDGLAREYPGKSADEHEFCAKFITSIFPQFSMRDFVKRTQLQSDYTFRNAGPGQKAIQILNNTRNLRATDPRDKIYGILGFFGDAQSDPENIFPAPDYRKTAAELYCDVARTIVIKTKTLDVLSACYGCVQTIPNLPSWAPSWNHTIPEYFSVTGFKAANDSCVMYEASGDKQSLKLKGKRVDVVKHVPETPERLEYNDLECTSLWRQWTDFAFSLQSYPTRESIADVLLHTFCWSNDTAWKRLELDEYRENFEAWLTILQSSNPLEVVAKDLYEDEMAYSYTHRAEFLIWGRVLSTTLKSYLALVPISASTDDQIVVLSGGKIPFVLRSTGNTFKIIGPCYVHGIMDGEAFPKEEAAEDLEWFTLR